MRETTDEDLTEALVGVERYANSAGNLSTADIGMKKATDTEERIPGYITATKADEGREVVQGSEIISAKEKIDEKIDEILDVSEDLLESMENPVLQENLMNSINVLLDELWEMRDLKEREFAKFIVLIQTITRGNDQKFNAAQIRALLEILQTFKKAKIVEIDIRNCAEIIKKAGLDIYRPLIKKPKLKIIIQEEK